MNQLLKAMLIPFVRILQILIALLIVFGVVIAVFELEKFMWKHFIWQADLIIHVVVLYLIAVVYSYYNRSSWWE